MALENKRPIERACLEVGAPAALAEEVDNIGYLMSLLAKARVESVDAKYETVVLPRGTVADARRVFVKLFDAFASLAATKGESLEGLPVVPDEWR